MAQLFESLRGRPPFMFELIGENGFSLTVGYSDSVGAVQHAASDGQLPYMMAVNEEAADDEAFVEFLAGRTPTPIPGRFCLPIERVVAIAQEFVATAEREAGNESSRPPASAKRIGSTAAAGAGESTTTRAKAMAGDFRARRLGFEAGDRPRFARHQ